MKANDLRKKSQEELSSELVDSLKEQFVLRMQRASGQLSRPAEMKKVRRKIARIKTIINEIKANTTAGD